MSPCHRPLASLTLTISLTFALLAPAAAQVAPLTGLQTLQQFNLVVFGDVASTSDVEGRSWIGGSLTGQANFVQRTLPASNYAGLTVIGNATGFNVDNGGVAIGGNASNGNVNNGGGVVFGNSSNVNFNGGTPSYVKGTRSGGSANSGTVASPAANATLQSYATAMNSTDFQTVLGNTSDAIKALAANSSITVVGNRATFNATADASGRAVFDIVNDAVFFSTVTEFQFNLGSATSVFINSDLASGTLNDSFLGGSAQSIASKVIWNFSDATALTFGSQWGGTVLATDAAVTTYGNIEGTLVAASLKQSAEIHTQPYTGRRAGDHRRAGAADLGIDARRPGGHGLAGPPASRRSLISFRRHSAFPAPLSPARSRVRDSVDARSTTRGRCRESA